MNKRMKKKRKDARKLEELEKSHYELKRDYRLALRDLYSCKTELQNMRNRPFICSHRVDPNYQLGSGFKTHQLQVIAPLRIEHSGPLHENDVLMLANKLSEALHSEAVKQLIPYVDRGMFR